MLLLKRESSSLLAPLSPSKQQLSLLSWVCAASLLLSWGSAVQRQHLYHSVCKAISAQEEKKESSSPLLPRFFQYPLRKQWKDLENDAMISEIEDGNPSFFPRMRNECNSCHSELENSVLSVSKTSQRFTEVCLLELHQDTHLDPSRSQAAFLARLSCWPFLWLKTKV